MGHLAGDKLARTGGLPSDSSWNINRCGVARRGGALPSNGEGFRQKRVSGENGYALAKNLVIGQLAAPVIIVVSMAGKSSWMSE